MYNVENHRTQEKNSSRTFEDAIGWLDGTMVYIDPCGALYVYDL